MSEALISADGRYLAIQQNDGNFVTYQRNPITGELGPPVWASGYVEPSQPPPNPTPIPTPPPSGTLPDLRIEGRVWRDGDRLWVPRFVSMLSALRPARSEDDWQRYWDEIQGIGFNGFRVFAGHLKWADQTVEIARRRLPRLLDLAASRGLVVEVTALTDSGVDGGYNTDRHLLEIEAITRGRPALLVELANEVGHHTQAEHVTPAYLRDRGEQMFREHMWAVGSTGDELSAPEEGGDYQGHGGRYITGHTERRTIRVNRVDVNDLLNNVRREKEGMEVSAKYGVPYLSNERIGADEVDRPGSRTNEPWYFFAAGVLDRGLPGLGGGTHHSEAGLHVLQPGPIQRQCAEAELAGSRLASDIVGDWFGYQNVRGHLDGGASHDPDAAWTWLAFEEPANRGPVVRGYTLGSGDRRLAVALHRTERLHDTDERRHEQWTFSEQLSPFPRVSVWEVRR